MSFLDKIKNIVNVDEDGYYPDDDVDTGSLPFVVYLIVYFESPPSFKVNLLP